MILLKKARIYDHRSPHHLKKMDVLIAKGIITSIAKNIKPASKTKVVESPDLCVSPGWVDIGTYNGEPGFEYRDDLNSLRAAAQKGGYCGLAPFPTGQPTIDNKGQLHFLKSKTEGHPVSIYPIAAMTKDRAGKEMSELLDLHASGAVAFSDGAIQSSNKDQLLKSMQYLKGINALTIFEPNDNKDGQLHEGVASVQMGMEGISNLGEESKVYEAIKLSEYANARILIHNISTASGLKEAKLSANKENISFSVPFLNLIKEDTDLLDFDVNLKVSPPIRDKRERKALCKAVESGQINVITSNHQPLSIEEKDQPFGLSQFGASTLESVFSALITHTKELSTERIIHCLSIGPRNVLKIDSPGIKKGENADLTIFDASMTQTFSTSDVQSKSLNNPFLGQSLKGKVIGIINGSKSTV